MANSPLKVQEFADSISSLSLFGRVDQNSFESAESERKELEKKARRERKKRNEEMKKEEEEKRRQEYEDYELALALEEEERGGKLSPRKFSYQPRNYGVGRANGLLNRPIPPIRKGRGIPPPQFKQDESPSTLLMKKEQQIKNQIYQTNGFESLHSNNVQLQVWQGHHTPDHHTPSPPVSDSTESQGQFEDANSVFSPSNSSPFQSVSSCESSSPLLGSTYIPSPNADTFPALPSPRPISTKTLPARKPRCAAKFTNPLDVPDHRGNDLEEANFVDHFSTLSVLQDETRSADNGITRTEVNSTGHKEDLDLLQQDRLAVLQSSARPLIPPRIRMSDRGVSINDLRPSRRITDPQLLNSDELLKNLFKTDTNFILNKNDFPPL